MKQIFNFFNGRTTFFAVGFFSAGCVLAFKGKLDGNFIAFMTALHGLIVAHSVSETYIAAKTPAGS